MTRPAMSEAAAQTHTATDAAPAGRAPLAFVVDGASSIRRFVSLVLQGGGVDTLEFADNAELREARVVRPPDLVLLDVSVDMQDALASIETLRNAGCRGPVQLMSGRGSAVLETVKQAGEQYGLRMLPVLKKPFETSELQNILRELKLGNWAPAKARIELAQALKNDWIEFWYQPKVDLRKKQLAGAEVIAHARHPQHGVLAAESFVPRADEASLLTLAERALVDALKFGLRLSQLGVNLRIAVDMTVNALTKLPIADIVRSHRAQLKDWAGLVLDITEGQIVNEIALASEMNKKLAEHNVKLAIDDFGKAYATLMKRKDIPFAEMKLDHSFVAGCGSDKINRPICKTVIDLAHSFGSLAVGIGVDKGSDAVALASMGCDLGQGFLLGRAMPQERFLSLLKQRATVRRAEQSAGAAPLA
jgi:EAL domain-containing protein (putative c-di-GMP-specific phosphodiesterase class I)/FixJ family two-component response regulator